MHRRRIGQCRESPGRTSYHAGGEDGCFAPLPRLPPPWGEPQYAALLGRKDLSLSLVGRKPAALSCHEEGCLYLRTSLIRPRPAHDTAPAPDPEFTFSAFCKAALALPGLFDRVDRELAEAYERSHDDEE